MPSHAEEVRIATAVPSRHAVRKTRSTSIAEKGSFEIVRTSRGTFARLSLCREERLHFLEGPLVDEWLVLAGVLGSVVDHESEVVRIPKDMLELAG